MSELDELRNHYDNNSTVSEMKGYKDLPTGGLTMICTRCGAMVASTDTHNKFHEDLIVLAKSIVFVGDGMDTVMAVMQGEEPKGPVFPFEEMESIMIRLGQLAGTRDVV